MKKKIWVPIAVVVAVLLVLFLPIPQKSLDDGGTREYIALTYKIIDWNKVHENGVYNETQVFFGRKRNITTENAWAQLLNDTRYREYTEPWVEKIEANKFKDGYFSHFVITKIYSNCFFAEDLFNPMSKDYQFKFNGTLSKKWCVGDQVVCTYENAYLDKNTLKHEADLIDIDINTYVPEPDVAYKPVIYLYPEKKTDVSVKLTLDGGLICTYPKYNDGWKVTALPDGTLIDAKNQTYNYLYWEGETYAKYDMTKGFCVSGEDTAKFLEQALEKLGLTRREANEFIVYWLPLMEQNPYNIISFQTDIYTEAAKLDVDPAPDTLIRVFMAWYKTDEYVNLPEQELSAPKRSGFTVVEWGGTEINN